MPSRRGARNRAALPLGRPAEPTAAAGCLSRQRIETDQVEILSGTWRGVSIGSPIALQVINRDYKLERLDDMDRPRPGHGDLTGAIKHLGSVRGVLERFRRVNVN